MRRASAVCLIEEMVRRTMLAVACGALLSCHMILGMDDLDVDSAPSNGDDGDGFDWDFDDSGSSDPDDAWTGTRDASPPTDSGADPLGDADTGDAAPLQKRVFVTSGVFAGNLGNVEARNERCQSAATTAGLDGTWIAWLSGKGGNAFNALTFDGPYVLLNGTPIVATKAELLKKLEVPIDVTEEGKKIGGANVWTGTRANGTVGDTCDDWSEKSALKYGTMGNLEATDGKWTDRGSPPLSPLPWSCSTEGHLYCFEQ